MDSLSVSVSSYWCKSIGIYVLKCLVVKNAVGPFLKCACLPSLAIEYQVVLLMILTVLLDFD